MTNRSLPVVLLHGFWHGSWCWSEVAQYLAAAGRLSVAVDMAGHGLAARRPVSGRQSPADREALAMERSPLADITLEMAANQLIKQIELVGGGAPVTVVAHSMGGVVLTRAAQQRPDLVARAVYAAAFMPASNVSVNSYASRPESDGELVTGLLRADPLHVGALRFDLSSPDDRRGLRAAFYGDVEPGMAEAALDLLTPDAPAQLPLAATSLSVQGWGSRRRTYIMCSADMAVRPPLQQLFISEADTAFPDNPTQVCTLPASHSPFLSMPQQLARAIIDTE